MDFGCILKGVICFRKTPPPNKYHALSRDYGVGAGASAEIACDLLIFSSNN